MKVLAFTPIAVDDAELSRRQARYDRLAPDGLVVDLQNLGDGSEIPRALETTADVAASESAVIDRYAAVDPSRYDVFMPDCVLDPGVGCSDQMARPMHGIGRLSVHYLAGLGLTTGAVARNRAIADELDRKLSTYGFSPRTAVLDLAVEQIADSPAWSTAVERAAIQLTCDAVINACSAVDVTGSPSDLVLLDPTATALRMLGMLGEAAR